ncbi:MAG TPA: substrate-binding domain-containing protein [Candidatus Didemnitutus sp.]|nr:substrate-binding domain-containing protein [Candidatus Didemnitutus sp.]
MKRLTLFAAIAAATILGGAERIAVIPKGTTHSFWKSVQAGALRAGTELGVEIVWKGPLKEDDRAQQIALVQEFVASDISAIVLAPLDDVALRNPVRSAAEHHIPVVIFDSALKGEAGHDFASFVATDNHRGGVLGGEELARLLHGKGKVVLLRYAEGSASTLAREAGFLEVMQRNPGIEVIVSNRYGGATTATSQDTAMNLVDRLREADGIFCSNESTTQGMLLALRQTGLVGQKKFVGFDTSPTLLAAMDKGDIDALVAQNPTKMGYLAVVTAVKCLRHEKFDTSVDTGCVLVTRENESTPEIRTVLGK